MLSRTLSTATNAATLQNELRKSYFRKASSLFLCVNNQKLAERVQYTIGDKLVNKNQYVFEASPGSGMLTKQLLQHGIKKIRVFEHIDMCISNLACLKEKYGDRLEIVDRQILDFVNGNYKMLDISREDMIKSCFDGIAVDQNWARKQGQVDMNSSIQLLTALSPFLAREFFSYLVYSLAHNDTFFLTGPTEFYLFVPLSQYKQILNRPSHSMKDYTSFTVLINSLFDYSEVDLYSAELKAAQKVKLDNRLHTILPTEYFAYTNGRAFKTMENFIFLSIKPKLMVNNMDTDFLISYIAFVKQSFSKRTNYAVKYYEKHFPGCAVDLIGLGISYFKTLGDLTSEEMLTIFSHFYQIPQYNTSIFREL